MRTHPLGLPGRRPMIAVAVLLTALAVLSPLAGTPRADAATSRYLQPVTTIKPNEGCIYLTPGMNGVKVKMVQRRLGFSSRTWETMDSATVAAVRRFQSRKGLHVDGVVGPKTWAKMGFDAGFCMDRWTAKVALGLGAAPAQRRDQMIEFARRYLGSEYVWGGAGTPNRGIDCSGLVLQALYSAGLDPRPISVDKHVRPAYRTSRELYIHDGLRHVKRSEKRRGDLIFYEKNSTGRVNHVAIYLGGGRMLEAVEPRVHVTRVVTYRSTQTMKPTVVRPFA
ncbi:MAG: NlpC/P60 family protein [Actinomycetes bacterium]